MAQWRLRSPGSFPLAFHQAMELPVGEHIVNWYEDWGPANAAQKEWRLFQFSLRNHTMHRACALLNNGLSRRTRVKWDNQQEKWALYVTVRESKQSRWADVEVIEKPIDSGSGLD